MVYSSYLVSAAKDGGLDLHRLMKMLMICCRMTKDACTQVNFSCQDCESLVRSLEGMGDEEFGFSDSGMEGGSVASQD